MKVLPQVESVSTEQCTSSRDFLPVDSSRYSRHSSFAEMQVCIALLLHHHLILLSLLLQSSSLSPPLLLLALVLESDPPSLFPPSSTSLPSSLLFSPLFLHFLTAIQRASLPGRGAFDDLSRYIQVEEGDAHVCLTCCFAPASAVHARHAGNRAAGELEGCSEHVEQQQVGGTTLASHSLFLLLLPPSPLFPRPPLVLYDCNLCSRLLTFCQGLAEDV